MLLCIVVNFRKRLHASIYHRYHLMISEQGTEQGTEFVPIEHMEQDTEQGTDFVPIEHVDQDNNVEQDNNQDGNNFQQIELIAE